MLQPPSTQTEIVPKRLEKKGLSLHIYKIFMHPTHNSGFMYTVLQPLSIASSLNPSKIQNRLRWLLINPATYAVSPTHARSVDPHPQEASIAHA